MVREELVGIRYTRVKKFIDGTVKYQKWDFLDWNETVIGNGLGVIPVNFTKFLFFGIFTIPLLGQVHNPNNGCCLSGVRGLLGIKPPYMK
ncbi:hypothetical protein A6F60_12075 (plasmid) [Levilactobacillus brevis]|nr:hypothetical protein A6F60_12075 [Levilactobacillus brevis]